MPAATPNVKTLAINCDMGESFGLYKMGNDEGIAINSSFQGPTA